MNSVLNFFLAKKEDWKGPWFPAPPGQSVPITPDTIVSKEDVEDNGLSEMAISDLNCDDGMVDISAFSINMQKISKKNFHFRQIYILITILVT